MKKRYRIESGEPRPSEGDEREWFVLDRSRACSRDCEGCPGTVVFVGATRAAARRACAQLNAEVAIRLSDPAGTDVMSLEGTPT